MIINELKSKDFWSRVAIDSRYSFIIKEIENMYAQYKSDQIPCVKYSERYEYYRSGNRTESEREYFRRRKHLSSVAILALLYPEKSYMTEVQDLIWAICDEYSWALPAHTDGTLEKDLVCIDLFSSETGFMLCELLEVFEDKIAPVIKNRVKKEIFSRIITPFENQSQPWEFYNMNRNAVCSAGVCACFIYLNPQGFDAISNRLYACMQRFVDGYPEDGTCLEGFTYWHYGFGYYVWFADMIKDFTNGQIDLFAGQKIRNIAGYPQRSFLYGPPDSIISFSDGSRSGKVACGLQHYLHKIYPSEIACLEIDRMQVNGLNIPFVTFLRTFLYYNPDEPVQKMLFKDYHLKDAGQVIINRDGYSLAIKAGHNGEQHNHNDIGHFIFTDKDGQALCDIGAGKYTKEYHIVPQRYTYFCPGSQGHSVPMFDGATQAYGVEHFGTLQFDGERVTIDFANAYALENLKKCRRDVQILSDGVELRDTFDYQGKITERFVSLREPVIKDGYVQIGLTKLTYDKKYEPSVTSVEKVENRLFPGAYFNVYCIDFHNVDTQFTLSITAEK